MAETVIIKIASSAIIIIKRTSSLIIIAIEPNFMIVKCIIISAKYLNSKAITIII